MQTKPITINSRARTFGWLVQTMAVFLFTVAATPASAAITLLPAVQNIAASPGDVVQFSVTMDFGTDPIDVASVNWSLSFDPTALSPVAASADGAVLALNTTLPGLGGFYVPNTDPTSGITYGVSWIGVDEHANIIPLSLGQGSLSGAGHWYFSFKVAAPTQVSFEFDCADVAGIACPGPTPSTVYGNVNAVPEPPAWAALIGGLVLLLGIARRKASVGA